ncbi:MAG: c-type cytochrome, methanol metabolism-related [Dongiaceae bacterium]
MNMPRSALMATLWFVLFVSALLFAEPAPAAPFDPEHPYVVKDDGTVDWYVYSGYRRYHADCHVCHGPDGMGSSFAPALATSMKTLTYEEFLEVVTNGRKNVNTASDKVMPAFGTNLNVMCFIDDLYAYLKARADNKIDRGRPAKHEDKPDDVKERDASCMGSGG